MSDGGKQREKIILKEGDEVIVNTKDVCNVFNECFVNTAKDMSEPDHIDINGPLDDIFSEYENHPSIIEINRRHTCNDENRFEFHDVTEADIFKKLSNLNVRKACGYDGQPPRLLFKKDDKMNKDKYRPVNVLVGQSKLFEGLMVEQLMGFMKSKLSDLLSAYRKGCGTQNVLLSAIEEWKTALDNDQHVGIVLMDLSKAFDAIPHGLLLSKLHAYGLSDNACEMIRSYLTDRRQRVKIDDVRSDWEYTIRGVPQGSQVGPHVFNIFLNDFFYFLEGLCQTLNYADDNSLAKVDHDLHKIKVDLEFAAKVAVKWFNDNFMKANASKFQVLCASRHANLPALELCIDGLVLHSEPRVKLLGVYIDKLLTFHYHITEMCRKASSQVRALARLSGMLDLESKFMIFNAFVVSNFMYCPLIWHMCSISDSKKIEKVQERALHYVLNDFNDTYYNLLQRTSKSTLYLTRLRFLAMEIFKVLNDMSPLYMKNLFIKKQTVYKLRDSTPLVQPKFKTITYGHNTLKYQGSKLWNKLPNNIKDVVSVNDFKNEIQKWSGPECHCGYCLQCSLARI